MKKDNSTIRLKVALRQRALKVTSAELPVLETHGGAGRIYERCYDTRVGVVLEKKPEKAEHLAKQRPTWRVYQCDSAKALACGLANDLAFGLVDIDPYGSPWPILEALLLKSRRQWPDVVQIVVNDGLRQKCKMGGSWNAGDLREMVEQYGNNLYPIYLEVAREKLEKIAGQAGFKLTGWVGYYCGHAGDMTHYWATLQKVNQ